MQRALPSPHAWNCGLRREVQQARLLQQVRQEREQGLIGTKDFAYQHETQQGCIRLITMGTRRVHARSPLLQKISDGYSGARALQRQVLRVGSGRIDAIACVWCSHW